MQKVHWTQYYEIETVTSKSIPLGKPLALELDPSSWRARDLSKKKKMQYCTVHFDESPLLECIMSLNWFQGDPNLSLWARASFPFNEVRMPDLCASKARLMSNNIRIRAGL
jgi:hypothetical protein